MIPPFRAKVPKFTLFFEVVPMLPPLINTLFLQIFIIYLTFKWIVFVATQALLWEINGLHYLERREYIFICFLKIEASSFLTANSSSVGVRSSTARVTFFSRTPYSFLTLHEYSPASELSTSVISSLYNNFYT